VRAKLLRNEIFISYSHKDAYWLERLQVHLKPYLREDSTQAWDDTKIRAGDRWKETINQALASAKVAVLLVSADFLASTFIYEEELPYLLQAANEKQVTMIPVAVHPCGWKTTPLKSIQWANNPDAPLSQLDATKREAELARIAELIADFVPRREPDKTPGQFAEEGLNALLELMRDPKVQRKVAYFEADFKTSSRQIEKLAYYKILHDLLHTLQFQCYNSLMKIVRAARRDPDDISVWDNVVMYDLALQNVVTGFHKAVQHTSQARAAQAWMPRLIQDLGVLSLAIEQSDAERIDVAIKPIQRILASEPSRINDRLVEAAEGLPMDALIKALSEVRDTIDGARVNPATVKRFVDGLKAIKEMDESLNTLIDSHNKWQEIDIVLRRIEGNMRKDLMDFSELENSWDDLKASTDAQCNSYDEQWAQLLKKEITRLDQALTDRDDDKIWHYFQSFRTRANYRFYEVDLALKELCDQLRRVGEPLTTVWEMVK
jgi:hypothetical protein